MLNEQTDEELVERYQAGDEEAFVVLYVRYGPTLAREGRRRGLSPEDAASLGHFALIEAAERFDPARHNSFRTFLWITWKRRLQDHFRKGPAGFTGFRTKDGTDVKKLQEARASLSGDADLAFVPSGEDQAEIVASYDFIRWADGELRAAILAGHAPERQLAVWVECLRRWAGIPHLSDTEIADVFGCNKSTVGRDRFFLGALFRELQRLRDEQDLTTLADPNEGRATGPRLERGIR